jgi:hypothetical protein
MRPKARIALYAVYVSVSYASFKRISITPIFGFDKFNMARASGIILFF